MSDTKNTGPEIDLDGAQLHRLTELNKLDPVQEAQLQTLLDDARKNAKTRVSVIFNRKDEEIKVRWKIYSVTKNLKDEARSNAIDDVLSDYKADLSGEALRDKRIVDFLDRAQLIAAIEDKDFNRAYADEKIREEINKVKPDADSFKDQPENFRINNAKFDLIDKRAYEEKKGLEKALRNKIWALESFADLKTKDPKRDAEREAERKAMTRLRAAIDKRVEGVLGDSRILFAEMHLNEAVLSSILKTAKDREEARNPDEITLAKNLDAMAKAYEDAIKQDRENKENKKGKSERKPNEEKQPGIEQDAALSRAIEDAQGDIAAFVKFASSMLAVDAPPESSALTKRPGKGPGKITSL